jgi:hypothetical protein
MRFMDKLLLEKFCQPQDTEHVIKSGFWYGNAFASPILVLEVFRQLVAQGQNQKYATKFTLDLTGKTAPIVEQIIEAGLANIKATDFVEANFSSLDNNERDLASRWGTAAGSVLIGKSGARPTIDWVVNGSLNLGVELTRDRSDKAIEEKLDKTSSEGVCGRHDSFIFVLKGTRDDAIRQVKTLPENKHSRVYTFVKNCNSLLYGTKVVKEKVVRNLPNPLSRPFTTMTTSAMRYFVKLF